MTSETIYKKTALMMKCRFLCLGFRLCSTKYYEILIFVNGINIKSIELVELYLITSATAHFDRLNELFNFINDDLLFHATL